VVDDGGEVFGGGAHRRLLWCVGRYGVGTWGRVRPGEVVDAPLSHAQAKRMRAWAHFTQYACRPTTTAKPIVARLKSFE